MYKTRERYKIGNIKATEFPPDRFQLVSVAQEYRKGTLLLNKLSSTVRIRFLGLQVPITIDDAYPRLSQDLLSLMNKIVTVEEPWNRNFIQLCQVSRVFKENSYL